MPRFLLKFFSVLAAAFNNCRLDYSLALLGMKKEETETNKEQASMTEDYYVENASCDEE